MTYTTSMHLQTYDCDCCGSYLSGYALVQMNGEEYTVSHDGHFGESCWDGDKSHLPFHVIGIMHNADQVNIIDPEWSWTVFSWDGVVPQNDETAPDPVYVTIEIRDNNGAYSFLVDGEEVFGPSTFIELIGPKELALYHAEGYTENCDMWETICNHYISTYNQEVTTND